jgi:hypothetical protein
MDWFKGKTSPEIIDFPMKYSGFRVKKSPLKTDPLSTWEPARKKVPSKREEAPDRSSASQQQIRTADRIEA